jgi:putative transposase
LEILDEGMANGARARELAMLLGVGLTTLQRWRRQFGVTAWTPCAVLVRP